LPSDIPLATLKVNPTALTRSVLNPRNFLMTKPERIVLTSGIPLPAAVYKTLTSLGFPGIVGKGDTDLVRRVRNPEIKLKAVAKAI
jgi:hypothetical protein